MGDEDKIHEQPNSDVETQPQGSADRRLTPDPESAAILEVAPLGIHVCDTQGRIVYVNPSQAAITGYSREDLVGTYIWDRIPAGPTRDALPSYLQRLLHEQPVPAPFFAKNLRKNGELFDARVDWNYLRDPQGEIIGFVSIVSDISAQKQAETELLESQRQLSTLMSHIPGMVYRCRNDRQWSMEFVSDGARKLTGYAAEDLIENRKVAFGELIHPHDRDSVWERVQAAVAQRQTFKLEYRITTAQGAEKWVWEQGVGLYADDGQVQAIEGLMADITHRKQMELELQRIRSELEQRVEQRTAELSESNEQLRSTKRSLEYSLRELQAIYDGMPEGFALLDLPSRRLLRVNSALCRLSGYSRDALLGMTAPELHPPTTRGAMEETLALITDNPGTSVTVPMLRSDGGLFQADVAGNLITVDGVPHAIIFFRDVTEQLQAEERRRQADAKYRALVESSPDPVVLCDLQGQILFASPQAAQRHGLDNAADLIGRSIAELVVETDRDLMQANIHRLLESGIRRNDEYTGLRSDGSTFDGEASAAVIYGVSHQPEAFVGIWRDITERKQTQLALREEQDALRRMLQASDRERELFTFELHDGVAQRLAAALLQFEAYRTVATDLPETAAAKFEQGLAALREASAEARSLMNRTRTPVLNRFGLRAAIADFIDQMGEGADAPEVTYRCEVQFGRLEPVLENAIFRVAQEAIANACRHSHSDLVRVSLIQHGADVTLEVQDQGIGFDTSRATLNRFGLDGIRERVRLLGKDLQIESTPGQGTWIRATFPVRYQVDDRGDTRCESVTG
jgi:PAS domain S-box-containing protein